MKVLNGLNDKGRKHLKESIESVCKTPEMHNFGAYEDDLRINGSLTVYTLVEGHHTHTKRQTEIEFSDDMLEIEDVAE
jgi:hypothetical protein